MDIYKDNPYEELLDLKKESPMSSKAEINFLKDLINERQCLISFANEFGFGRIDKPPLDIEHICCSSIDEEFADKNMVLYN